MQILEPYIPKEYLALRINYCKKILKDLPEVMVSQRLLRGKKSMFAFLIRIIIVLAVQPGKIFCSAHGNVKNCSGNWRNWKGYGKVLFAGCPRRTLSQEK
ncbi:MAG: hypothetical protein IJL19_00730 [Clostridiales bacterium]|nr:hypothetical protein [Clostridiales bacterium]